MSKPIDLFKANVDLALLHKLELEKRIAEQKQQIARLKHLGSDTRAAEDFLQILHETLELVIEHVIRLSDTDSPKR
jgi:hypothetical protein